MEKKMIAIGIDGASHRLVKKWIKEGKLPALAKISKKGFFSRLESTLPPLTAPANATIATGYHPGEHGVFDFIGSDPLSEFRLVDSRAVKKESLWRILSDNGKRCCVINMPVTYPPEELNGIMVSGILSPDPKKAFNPLEVFEEIKKAGINYRIGGDIALKDGDEEKIIEYYSSVFQGREKLAKFLLKKEDWDFFLVYFNETDIVPHFFWKHMDKTHPKHTKEMEKYSDIVYSFYKKADDFVDWILKNYPERTIVLFSDHGFCPLYGTLNLNIFLKEKKLLFLKKNPITLFKRLAFTLGFTPSNVYSLILKIPFLKKMVSKKSLEEKEKNIGRFLSYSDIDWNKTIAFSRGHMGQIHLTTDKKNKEEYRKAMEKTKKALKELVGPNGKKLKIELFEGKKLYNGSFAHRVPDLYIIVNDFHYISFPLFASSNRVFEAQLEGDSATHDREGILLGKFPDEEKKTVKKASLEDIAPSVLSFFGFKAGDLTGSVLKPFKTRSRKKAKRKKPGRKGKKISKKEREKVENRLKGLGYL